MKSFPRRFSPLSHVEIAAGERYRAKIGGVMYECDLMSAVHFVRFFTLKDHFVLTLEKMAEPTDSELQRLKNQTVMILALHAITALLWSIRTRRGIVREFIRWIRGDGRRFRKFLFSNVDQLWQVFEQVLAYNGRLLRWTSPPSDLYVDAGVGVECDWFRSILDGADGSTEKWIALISKRELDKEKGIHQLEINRAAERRMKNG